MRRMNRVSYEIETGFGLSIQRQWIPTTDNASVIVRDTIEKIERNGKMKVSRYTIEYATSGKRFIRVLV